MRNNAPYSPAREQKSILDKHGDNTSRRVMQANTEGVNLILFADWVWSISSSTPRVMLR